jgi:predicted nucleotidyltransferase component of viral defense system
MRPKIQDEFELFAAIQTLSLEDPYGGKICAALGRQHPRDLHDVKLLLENEGITEQIRTAFMGYLISYSRPIHELLNPNPIELEGIYRKEFKV